MKIDEFLLKNKQNLTKFHEKGGENHEIQVKLGKICQICVNFTGNSHFYVVFNELHRSSIEKYH